MDVREKLVELLNEVQETGVNEIPAGFGYTSEYVQNEEVASHLIAHGVTVQECKLGDKIYQTDGVRIYESIIGEITLTTKRTIFVTENIAFDERAIGNSVFLSYAEAVAHLINQPKGE